MFAAESQLIDRAVPFVEEIYLPEAATVSGECTFELTEDGFSAPETGSSSLASRVKKKIKPSVELDLNASLGSGGAVVDLRLRSPNNWAHAFTNHFPVALLARQFLEEQGYTDTYVLLPELISGKIVELFTLSGFFVENTDQPVRGRVCQFSVDPWISIRGERVDIVSKYAVNHALSELMHQDSCVSDKVYLARKDSRKIINESEIDHVIDQAGFSKIYMEDLTLEEQLSTLTFASEIVAVHGASLGPLILRALHPSKQLKLIEIFSPAHVTNVWRVLASQLGASWCGVRGRIWPELVGQKPNFTDNKQDFLVSAKSVEMSLEHISS